MSIFVGVEPKYGVVEDDDFQNDIEVVIHKKRGLTYLLSGVAAALLVLGLAPTRHVLESAGMLPKAAHFTEMYATGVSIAPVDVVYGQQNTVSFALSNHEAKTTRYTWIASIANNAGSQEASRGTVEIGPGKHANIAVPFIINADVAPVTVMVPTKVGRHTVLIPTTQAAAALPGVTVKTADGPLALRIELLNRRELISLKLKGRHA